jgi:serine/threonine protein kinase
MAPEHTEAADPRNDLWAAGVLLLECVTGQRPQDGGAHEVPGELPRRVRDMVVRAVDRDPDNRPSTASDMRVALGIRPARPCARRRWRRAILPAVLACLAVVGVVFALPEAPAGPLIPRDGRWRGDPPAGTPWETELQRIDDVHYSYKNVNHFDGQAGAGTLTLEMLSDGTTILSGKIADLPTCATCNHVGFIEFIILDDTHIYQNRASWGLSHDNYTTWYPEYRYKWEGKRRDAAE